MGNAALSDRELIKGISVKLLTTGSSFCNPHVFPPISPSNPKCVPVRTETTWFSLTLSCRLSLTPLSLSLSPHKHTHKQCLSKVQRPSTCAVSKQNVLPMEFKICGGWITGFYFLPVMKLYFALKQQLFHSLENSLLYNNSQHQSFSVKHHFLQSHCNLFLYVFIFVLFYWPKSLVTYLFLDIRWTMVWTTYTTIYKSKTI